MQRIWTIFNENTVTCVRRAIKIDERENFPRKTSFTHNHFSLIEIHRNENRFLADNGECLHHSEVTLNTSHNFFNVIIRVYSNSKSP